ncbi:class I SAM-dependent methyltransferase [Massilia sp. LXY-6]|uniref:class I SAM-dependent methyltransferase n=1 Tax=Massilia sp. LXY-6 TaxID=3379823 RepID=UPI003EE223D5
MFNSARTSWWRLAPNQLLEKYSAFSFDKRHGTDTKTFAELRELDISSENKRHGERYQPSPVYSLRRLLKRLKLHYPTFSFVDFGSGKGRTLLVASELPFRQVIGVEFSEDLHRTAEDNIKRYGSRLAGEVEAVHADATQFALPSGDLVLYFFNPFTKPVLDKVLENIVRSATAEPRRIILIYLYLPEQQWITGLEGFRLQERWRNYDVFECSTT